MRIHEVYISHDSETVQVQKCAQVLKGVTLSPDNKTPKHNAYSAAITLAQWYNVHFFFYWIC